MTSANGRLSRNSESPENRYLAADDFRRPPQLEAVEGDADPPLVVEPPVPVEPGPRPSPSRSALAGRTANGRDCDGTDAIRAALAARNKKLNLAALARDHAIPADTFENFIAGRTKLSPEVLALLATVLFNGHAVFDASIDRLRPAKKQEPRSLGVRPPPFVPDPITFHAAPPPPRQTGYALSQKPKQQRAGWVKDI